MSISSLVIAFFTPPIAGWVWWRLRGWSFLTNWLAAAATGMVISNLPPSDIGWFIDFAISLVVALILMYWDSGHRKRASKAIGDKARLIRARMVRTMRERKPRPRLAPQPV